jgi:thymidylate synthase ThyX
MITAKIIADSLNTQGNRITSMIVTFPRFILAEFNTHRMFSRNSASSRAIPFKKMLKMVEENPFIPIAWQKDHKGMQGIEYFTDEEVKKCGIVEHWLGARDFAINRAKALSEIGTTKQICNRLLEPFMWHTVIVTGSEWENFFALRAHPAAEIHIAKLAELMLEAYNDSTPQQLKEGEWHIPFGDNMDLSDLPYIKDATEGQLQQLKLKISVARCARISYQTLGDDPKIDYEADIKLHDMLLSQGHMSPFEHCAKAMSDREYTDHICGKHTGPESDNYEYYFKENVKGWCGNFRGFIQYRKLFPGENKNDSRVISK